MKQFFRLVRLQMLSWFGINRLLHGNDPAQQKKGRRGVIVLAVVVLAVGNMSLTYSAAFGTALSASGQTADMLGLMFTGAAALSFVMALLQTQSVLFKSADYDTLMSLPVPVGAIAASRLTMLVLYNLLYSLVLLLPALGWYAVHTAPPAVFYPAALLLTLVSPVLPSVLGALIGTLIAAATARMRFKRVLRMAVQLVLLLGVMALSFSASSFETQLETAGAAAAERIYTVYPPAAIFTAALGGTDVPAMLLLFVGSLALLLAAALLLGCVYRAINTFLLAEPSVKRGARLKQRRTPLRALIRMEAKRYFSSAAWAINTLFGYLIMLGGGVALLIVGRETLTAAIPADMGLSLPALGAAVLSVSAAFSATTPAAVSMEGKRISIVRALPVSGRDWLTAKLALYWIICVPVTVVAAVLFAVALRPSFAELLLLLFTPLCVTLLAGVAGLALNLRFPRFDWTNEAEIVKQSVPVMVMVFLFMLICAAMAGLTVLTGNLLTLLAADAVLLAVALLLLVRMLKRADETLRTMEA